MQNYINYHSNQEKIEKKYYKDLLALFLILIDELSQLTDFRFVDILIRKWYMEYYKDIYIITERNIYDLEQLSNIIINNLKTNSKLTNELINANIQLIKAEIDKLKEQFITLDVQANTYGYPNSLINQRIATIKNSMDNSLELLVVNQCIQNFRELAISSAKQHNYTEYLGMTQNDDRVRETHTKYYHNKWIKFDEPPKIGHIGSEINCRCLMIEFR